MNSRERVEAAFCAAETDKVPIAHVSFSSQVASDILGREAFVGFGVQEWREAKALWEGPAAHAEFLERSYRDTLQLNRQTDQDLLRFSYGRCPTRPTRRVDEYTFLFEDGPPERHRILQYDPQHEHYSVVRALHPRPPRTFEDLEAQVEAAERALETYRPTRADFSPTDLTMRARRELGDAYAIRASGASIAIPRDEIWLEATVLRPALVGRLLDVQVERAVRAAKPLVEEGFRYLFGGGDFAGNQGPLYSPRVFHDLMAPRLARMSQALHALGARWLFASDGDLWPVADDLFGASGVDGYYEIDSDAGMDLVRLRERFPRLTLVGNISSRLLHRGSRREVEEAVHRCVEEAKRLKGVLVGVSNMVMPGTPAENVWTMIETLRKHR